MPLTEGRTTIPGTALPEGSVSPTLAFHKWHRYDTFTPDYFRDHKNRRVDMDPFDQKWTRHRYLDQVASLVQAAGREHYPDWYCRFDRACQALGFEGLPKTVRTEWRMVVGWGTNPALEAGLTLESLHGFPYIPGTAVKGLMHRVGEEALWSLVPAPIAPGAGPEPVPERLPGALLWASRIRVLFGSLHLRAANADQPSSALERLERWLSKARKAVSGEAPADDWEALLPTLERVCSPAATGGMVTCFDAVPAEDSFRPTERPILTVDVLTPHTGTDPNPITFLAVRDGVAFELRFRVDDWPQDPPRDDAEEERAEAMAGMDREKMVRELELWLLRGLSDLGAGGKTAAGYGHLFHSGNLPAPPEALPEETEETAEPRPVDPLPPPDPWTEEARKLLPEGLFEDQAITRLDEALTGPPSRKLTAVIHRFRELFPKTEGRWRGVKKLPTVRRLRRIAAALAEEPES